MHVGHAEFSLCAMRYALVGHFRYAAKTATVILVLVSIESIAISLYHRAN